ncbi:MAG: NADH:ubiquinone reductase (Na(+)-transporting) subunit A, partial [Muribaculaceae bacterium]|nr:NADH:ubiquinone reductase (Na(+)-transporting) subunit A [Muribaculaceae bacterium]
TFDPVACVAVTGPEVKNPGVLRTVIGAPVEALVKGNLMPSDHHQRIISGTVLTGEKVGTDGYLHYPYRQITVIAEGDDKDEFLGWASLSPSKMSASKTFPGHFLKRLFKPDARIQGGRRAMIMSGQYDKTIPMDIMPEYLIKAIMGRDIEAMEKLGIYEVAPEDFALAEYADTSKLPLQKIVREGLDYIRKELQ